MQLTYTILGSDGQTYGPVPLDQAQTWITEGRITKTTQICRSDKNTWQPAEEVDEFIWPQPASAPAFSPAIPGALVDAHAEARQELTKRMISGASWFFWIAGLSAINTIAIATGGDWTFILGLGITQVFDVVGKELGSGAL